MTRAWRRGSTCATHARALEIVPLELLREHALDAEG